MVLLVVLFEHAAGYALFRCQNVEDIGSLLPEVQEAMLDFSRFSQMVELEAFYPFKSGANALDNINSISEGVLHDDLKAFLMNNVPLGKKKKKANVLLGVADTKLGAAIQEGLDINCQFGGVVLEVLRGVRLYFHRLVKGLTGQSAAKAQLGLGHSYSRAKVKFNVHRADNMIIQSISLLDQLDKDINTFSMRIREWYSYHFPELIKLVPDNYTYAQVAKFIGNRSELSEDKIEQLEELLMDSTKAQAVYEASRFSMGMEISPVDLINIQLFAARVTELTLYRRKLSEYLSSKMLLVAPNLTTLIGEQVGARLISHAGSLTNLAKYPASTVQILGAEKALFSAMIPGAGSVGGSVDSLEFVLMRALKTRGNTPKYGLIFHSTFIGRAGSKNKGRISRYLANKCSIASRIDCFTDFPTTTFGDKLRGQVEERLVFYETGEAPKRNLDVMKAALTEVMLQRSTLSEKSSISPALPLSAKKRKRKHQDVDVELEEEVVKSEKKSAKKKKRKHREEEEEEVMDEDVAGSETESTTKKKSHKKRKSSTHA